MNIDFSRRSFCEALAVTTAALAPPSARAAKFPEKPIRIIIGYAAGGASESISREFAARLCREIGQPVIIDNKPGAGQIVSMLSAQNSPSDGYTLVAGNPGSHSISPNLYKNLPYDPRQFIPVSPITAQANILVSLPSFQASSFSELVKLSRSRKQPLNYASLGIGSAAHLAMEMFKKRSGIDLQHIPYKGDSPALLAIKSGEVDLGVITTSSALPRIRDGELKGLGVFQNKPDPYLTTVQTTAQAGYPEIDLPTWAGIFAPPKTPKAVADYLQAASRRVVESPEFATFAASRASQPLTLGSSAFAAMIQDQSLQIQEIIRAINLRPE
jgi:tripartite-type tricarboxylate transporter receptor subunit TctC